MDKGNEQRHLTIARIMRGIQQQELADMANKTLPADQQITQVTISKLEKGWKKTLTSEQAKALCQPLNITMEELTKGGIRVRE